MITNFKIYEKKIAPKYYYFNNDDFKYTDVNYFINIIKTNFITENEEDRLFYWACINLPELALTLVDYIPTNSIIKNHRGVAKLPYDYFKSILKNDNVLNKLIISKDFLTSIVYYNNDVKKLKLLEYLGAKFNQDLLISACWSDNLSTVKFLINTGLDPNKKKNATFSYAPENCLDIATQNNKKPDIIKYLVDLGVEVTYRQIHNVILNNNLDAVPFLVNSKNIIDDYSYSNYATRQENRIPYQLYDLITLMLTKNLNKYIKNLLNREKNKGYDILQTLTLSSLNTPDNKNETDNKYLNPKNLELAYWIIDNYNGKYENSYTTRFITYNNEKFWFNKMKQNPSIISKLRYLNNNILKSYEYQKIILDADSDNLKYIKDILNPKIEKEFDYIINTNKFNI